MLLGQNAGGQRFLRVAGLYRHAGLQDDRPAIDRAMVDEERLDSCSPGAVQGCRPLPIGDHDDDLSRIVGSRRRIQEYLEIGAAARDQDTHAKAITRGHQATSSTPRAPATISPIRATCSPAPRRIRAVVSVVADGTITT